MKTTFSNRSFTPANTGFARFMVERMSWEDEGGPKRAWIRASGPLEGLAHLAGFLRYGVEISEDESGAPAWWGYVNAVEVHAGGVVYRVSLDGLWNRVAVRWRDENPLPGDSPAWQYQSAWADDLPSQQVYGVKEQVFHLGESRADQASAAAQTYLARLRKVTGESRAAGVGETAGEPYALLECSGWWETLDWQFYAQDRGYTGNIQAGAGGLNQAFGQAAGSSQVEQRVTVTGSAGWTARWFWARLYRVGAVADNLIAELLTAPSSGVIASQTVAGTSLSLDSAGWYVFDLGPVTVTPGVNYYFRLRRSGAVSAGAYYGCKVEENALLGANQFSIWNGSAWTARSPSASLILGVFGQDSLTAQITGMASAAQFLNGAQVKTASGVTAKLFRSGKNRLKAELLDLARSGSGAGKSLRLWINAARLLVVEARPDPEQVELKITTRGEIRHITGRRLAGGENPVGRFALVEGLALMGDTAGADAVVYVERAEWVGGVLRAAWS